MTEHPTEQRPRELISRRAYQRRKGWKAPSYVVQLCQEGRIPLFVPCPACGVICNVLVPECECGETIAGAVDVSRAKVDPVLADRALEATRHPEKMHVVHRHAEARGEPLPPATSSGELPLSDGDGADDENVVSYTGAKARHELAKAERAELELRHRRGELGDLREMRREAFSNARQLRDTTIAMIDRLAPVLAAETDPARVHFLLLQDTNRVFDEHSRQLGEPAVAAG